MKDPSQTPIGQGMVLVLGAAMLLLGVSSAMRSIHLGRVTFVFKGTVIDGVFAAVLLVTFLLMGAYLFFSALRKIRRGSYEA
jgi:hypothetical protein